VHDARDEAALDMEDRPVVGTADNADTGIASEGAHGVGEPSDGRLEMERILRSDEDVDLSDELRTERRPRPFQQLCNIVMLFPIGRNRGVDDPRFAIE